MIGASSTRGAPVATNAFAIVNARIVPMDRETVLHDHGVVVRSDRIVAVAPTAELPIPPDAITIDAGGKTLLPGLGDMHVHLVPHQPGDGEDMDGAMQRARDALLVFLANGVTSLRNMAGTPLHLRLRDEVRTGAVLGPRIWSCGPVLETRFTFAELEEIGRLVTSVEEARAEVMRQKAQGFDFIKVYNDLDGEIYDAILATAREVGIRVVGHVAFQKGLSGALAARQDSIEHLRSYDFAADTRTGEKPFVRYEGWLHTSPQRIAELAERTAEAGSWNVPTMVVEHALRTDEEIAAGPAPVESAPLPSWLREELESGPNMETMFPNEARRTLNAGRGARGAMVKALDDVGAGLLAGSDCPACKLVPGRSLLRELELMVDAGLSPWRALRTATVSVAEFLESDAGTIAPGKQADLLLVDGDPLTDIGALRRQSGVAIGGHWLPTATIEKMILDAR
jgi:imidazolonepropionase-like amidohydrolase